MNLKHPLTLPILWNSAEMATLVELGLPVEGEPHLKLVTFYSIEFVYPTTIGEELDSAPATAIRSGGVEFLCPDVVGVVNSAIKDRL